MKSVPLPFPRTRQRPDTTVQTLSAAAPPPSRPPWQHAQTSPSSLRSVFSATCQSKHVWVFFGQKRCRGGRRKFRAKSSRDWRAHAGQGGVLLVSMSILVVMEALRASSSSMRVRARISSDLKYSSGLLLLLPTTLPPSPANPLGSMLPLSVVELPELAEGSAGP
jgi:hypothetical protein